MSDKRVVSVHDEQGLLVERLDDGSVRLSRQLPHTGWRLWREEFDPETWTRVAEAATDPKGPTPTLAQLLYSIPQTAPARIPSVMQELTDALLEQLEHRYAIPFREHIQGTRRRVDVALLWAQMSEEERSGQVLRWIDILAEEARAGGAADLGPL